MREQDLPQAFVLGANSIAPVDTMGRCGASGRADNGYLGSDALPRPCGSDVSAHVGDNETAGQRGQR